MENQREPTLGVLPHGIPGYELPEEGQHRYGDEPEHILASQLRAFRDKLGMTQAELAREMSARGFTMRQTTIAKIEANQRPIRVNEATMLAAVLRVELADLLMDPEHRGRLADLKEEAHELLGQLRQARNRLAEHRAARDAAEYGTRAAAEEVTALEGRYEAAQQAVRDLATLATDAQDARARETADDTRARVVTIRPQASANPRSTIAEKLRDGHAVVLDLNAAEADAERIADFAAGVILGLGGTIERTGGDGEAGRLLLLIPADIPLAAEDLARIESAVLEAVTSGDATVVAAAASTAWRKILTADIGNEG